MGTEEKVKETSIPIGLYRDFSTPSFKTLESGVIYEDPKFHLNLVHTKKNPSKRPIIHSNKWERLAYYRSFTSTASKTELIETQQVELNSFLWFYAFNVCFKSLPHGFVHFFLAAYAPKEHMFVAKMVPFSHGIKYLFVVVGFLEMLLCVDMMVMMCHYVLHGLLKKNPWNRCASPVYFNPFLNLTVHCYGTKEFAQLFANKTYEISEYTFINEDDEHFQVAQLLYYRAQVDRITSSWDITVFIVLWIVVQILSYHAWKKYFWKFLHICHWGINFIDFCTFAYLIKVYIDTTEIAVVRRPKRLFKKYSESDSTSQWPIDLEMLAESITAPPIVHVLTSRSVQEIDPTMDSTVMVISNALICILRGLLTYMVKLYCEALVNTEMPFTKFNEHSWFYFWPMFWQTFFLGDIFSMIYVSFSFTMEMLVIAVTYLCVSETVVYEWPRVKHWMVTCVFTVSGVVMYCVTSVDSRAVLWAYGKGIATLSETIFLYIMYPIGRLVDDYTFHYGVAPTRLRILSIRLVPVYYMFKAYIMFSSLWDACSTTSVGKEVSHYTWSWALMLLPIGLGMLYIMFKYIVRKKTTWTYMLRPVPKWGPHDISVRQLRKRFDSRFYISSEVPRLLSRYLFSKRDSKVYKVDVRYDMMPEKPIPEKAARPGEDKKEKTM